MNDKIIIVPAILVLAVLAYFKPDKIVIDFYMILASGLFGLVAGTNVGLALGKKAAENKEK